MPGIVGFISARPVQDCRAVAEQMTASMRHEPSYHSGTLVDERSSGCVGWVCHARSYSDCLPVWNETRDIALIFVGEHYSDQDEADRLRALGHAFAAGNAEYLVHLYEELGPQFFETLNGVFSGVVLDLRENKLVLFNDRYGLGRIYYHEAADGFYFASEAKAILRVLPHLRRLDSRGLGERFACGCVLQNRTLFPELSLLPPASAWTFRRGESARKDTYFIFQTWEGQTPLPEKEYYEKLRETFTRVLPHYFGGNQPMAMSLTGGLDGRIIMAWARRPPSALPCYSHRGLIRECADARIARRVATVCRQPHRTLTVDGRFLTEFPELAARAVYLTDGTMEIHGATGLYVNRMAREQIAPVRMTGNYGGEVLRGIVMLGPAKLRNPFFSSDFSSCIEQGVNTLNSERQCSRTSFILRKQMPWHHYSRFALESSQLTIRSPYLDNELVALAFRAPLDLRVNQQFAARLIEDGNPELARFPTDRGPLGRHGLRGRLGERYQEFTFKADYAYDYGMPDWLVNLDRALAPLHLERMFLGRHKYYHFRYWYRHQLAGYVREILLDPRSLARPYLDRRQVEKMVDVHVSGRGNYTLEIHGLLSTELLQRRLIDN